MGEHEHPCFFCWLAGFIDGEGCFYIASEANHGWPWYRPRMAVQTRIDDKPILDEILARTGLGTIRVKRITTETRARISGINDSVHWSVNSKRDCARLVMLLEGHPLRAKKRDDFEIWAAAIRLWQSKSSRRNRAADWTDIGRLKQELEAGRSSGLDGFEPLPDAEAAEHQLSLSTDQGQVVDVPL